jgi:hypothetical protein
MSRRVAIGKSSHAIPLHARGSAHQRQTTPHRHRHADPFRHHGPDLIEAVAILAAVLAALALSAFLTIGYWTW